MTALVFRLRRLALALALLGVAAFGQAEDKAAIATTVEIGLADVKDFHQMAPVDPKTSRGSLARLAGLVESLRREHPATLFAFGGLRADLRPAGRAGTIAPQTDGRPRAQR